MALLARSFKQAIFVKILFKQVQSNSIPSNLYAWDLISMLCCVDFHTGGLVFLAECFFGYNHELACLISTVLVHISLLLFRTIIFVIFVQFNIIESVD